MVCVDGTGQVESTTVGCSWSPASPPPSHGRGKKGNGFWSGWGKMKLSSLYLETIAWLPVAVSQRQVHMCLEGCVGVKRHEGGHLQPGPARVGRGRLSVMESKTGRFVLAFSSFTHYCNVGHNFPVNGKVPSVFMSKRNCSIYV